MSTIKDGLLAELDRRVADKILEPTNAELLKKLITNADTDNEAMMIAELGTTYKRTGLHFDKRLEKMTNDIRYFKKNKKLSFHTDDSKPTHKLIIGDNYEALQNLLIQYKGMIDVIYIDPPYGKDSMGEFAQTNYENAITRDNLLSMLYPRLMLAKMLLSDNGVIFCSIDDKNQAYVKCLFDEVFGEENFITNFIWEKTQHFGRQKVNFYSNVDYIITYAKQRILSGCGIKELLIEKVKKELEDAPLFNASNPEKKLLFKKGTVKFNLADGIYETTTDPKYTLHSKVIVKKGLNENDFELSFSSRWARQTVLDELEKGTTYWIKSSNFAIRAIYGDGRESKVSPKQIIFSNSNNENVAINKYGTKVGTNEEGSNCINEILGNQIFDYPKPHSLISYLVSLIEKENPIILDFFAGSGTTGHAVLDLNRSEAKEGDLLNEAIPEGSRTFILCQLNEITDTTPHGIAYDVTAKRLKRIMTGKC
ncbi:MAG: site-specific DNA-methyltransferase, partial [Bacteroidales bacterium]|nr:site-specific DNA-methyltransferase [Bacteroidales bacterium]